MIHSDHGHDGFLIESDQLTALLDEFLNERIQSIVDPAKIDVVVCNHIEMDHSSSLPAILKVAPNAAVYASAPQGVKELKAFYGEDLEVNGVKTGDTLSIGKRRLGGFVP